MSNASVVTASRTSSAARPGADRHRLEEVHDVAVLDHHALGATGRARRVDDVREIVRASGHTGVDRRGGGDRLTVGAVELDRGDRVVERQGARERRCGDDGDQAGVARHVREAISRERGVERHVRRARLEDSEQRGHECRGASEMEPDAVAALHAARHEMLRETMSGGTQLAVCEGSVDRHDGGAVRTAFDLGRHELVDASVGERHGRAVPLDEHLLTFGRAEQHDRRDRSVGGFDRAGDESLEMVVEVLDGGRIEEGGRVLPCQGEGPPAALVGDDERKVELRRHRIGVEWFHLEAGERGDQRCVLRRSKKLHHHLEGGSSLGHVRLTSSSTRRWNGTPWCSRELTTEQFGPPDGARGTSDRR